MKHFPNGILAFEITVSYTNTLYKINTQWDICFI